MDSELKRLVKDEIAKHLEEIGRALVGGYGLTMDRVRVLQGEYHGLQIAIEIIDDVSKRVNAGTIE